MATTTHYSDAAVFVDGKLPKLRASCDGCNESKVRCSQAKPKCARCEKQGISCIYGLSRRSHKNAPRIGESATLGQHSIVDNHNSVIRDPEIMPSPNLSLDGSVVSASLPSDTEYSILEDTSLLSYLMQIPEFSSNLPHIDETIDLAAFASVFNPIEELPTTAYDISGRHMSIFHADTPDEVLGTSDAMDIKFCDMQDGLKAQPCNCVSEVVKQLTVMAGMLEDTGSPFDTQLLQLRMAINTAENSINCPCITKDQICIMISSSLFGFILRGFELTLPKIRPSFHAIGSDLLEVPGNTTANTAAPRLSWGMLQIEPDEENELKEHLWLLHFRKLQKVVKQFSASVCQLRNGSQEGENSTHIIACQFTYMWLSQRTEAIKDKLLAQGNAQRKSNNEMEK